MPQKSNDERTIEWAGQYALRVGRLPLPIPERPRSAWWKTDYPIVPGRFGSIRATTDGWMSLMYVSQFPSPRRFGNAYRKAKRAGMEMCGRGDTEGHFYFRENSEAQSRLAIELIRARRRRIGSRSPGNLAALVRARATRNAAKLVPIGV